MAMFVSAPVGVALVARDTQRITSVNPRLVGLFGYPQEMYLGSTIKELPIWSSPFDTESSCTVAEVLCSTGEIKWARVTVATVDDERYYPVYFEDDTERQRLKDELRQVRSRLEEAHTLAKMGFWERHLPSGAVMWSEQMERIYGIPQPSTAQIIELIHPDDRAAFVKRMEVATEPGKIYELDYRIVLPDGTIKHIWSRAQPEVDRNGKLVKRFGTVQDITERKLMEQRLREAEEIRLAEAARRESEARLLEQKLYYSSVINEAPVIIFVKDSDGRYTLANKALAEHWGTTIEDIIGKTDFELRADQDLARSIREKDIEIMDLDQPCVLFQESVHACTGERRIFQTIKSPMRLADGTKQLLGIATDITERRQAEEARVISEMRYRRLFEASKEGILLISLANGQISDINPSLLQMTGYSREDYLGIPIWQVALFKDVWHTREEFLTFVHNNPPLSELHVTTREGQRLVLEIASSVYSIDREWVVQFSLRDVTEKQRINEGLARLDRLNIVGEMAASIAHEIRNPMTTVRGFLQLFGMKEEALKHDRIVKLMIEEIDRANSIITNYLSLARTNLGKATTCNLGALVRQFAPVLNADVLMRERNINYDLHDTTPLTVYEGEIKQLLANLVRNACEAMQSGGTVTISTEETPTEVCLVVRDEGCGIPTELLPKLGTPFLTTRANGVGLGLAICYRIAERHGATISIDTSPAGSTFKVCFPLPQGL